ncbi:MAG: 16S rRNA (guanine(966)-N(2))-methyltransferase RsmD [Lachnospiraceae bacterium]|nr:16S rRNA (guanine(966)-N(2))-methyltransferase RsmD [Lachnospiraceae bacterium]
MRVIAGEARRLKLVTPKGDETRPTSDKTKETLFNVLSPYIYSDTCFLDLYSGSGGIGIEALSRGAATAVFVEKSKEALSCIETNLKTCHFEERGRIVKGDVVAALHTLNGRESFDIVFMDPPYNTGAEQGVLSLLSGSKLLREDGLVVVEASNETDFSYLEGLGFTIIKQKIYKNNQHVFIQRSSKTD